MRSQHFELSTNEKPRFQPDFWCRPDTESTNPMQISQFTDNLVSLESQLTSNVIPIECKLTGNQLPIESQVTSNLRLFTTFTNHANGIPILCQLTNPLIIVQSCVNQVIGRTANRSFPFIKGKRPISPHFDELLKFPTLPMEFQLTIPVPIDQSSVNCPILCQSRRESFHGTQSL